MSASSMIKQSVEYVRGSLTFKLFVIGFLLLVLQAPALMVQSLIREREQRHQEAVSEISGKWGGAQTLSGPILTVPFRRAFTRDNGVHGYETLYAHFLPKSFEVKGLLEPEIRYRGIYQAVLYDARLDLRGRFEHPDFAALHVADADVLWDRAVLSLGVSDMKGIREAIAVTVGRASLAMEPGIETREVLDSGVSARLPAGLARGRELPFQLGLDLDGSDALRFVPVGEVTLVRLGSKWSSPSFDGAFLPVERRVGDDGFSASWKVLHLNRNFPQAWIGARERLTDSAFGVRLFTAVDVYQEATRTAKYASLFMVLTFAALFFGELSARRRLHALQYLLVGFALALFYTLLVALSEHLRFGWAYLVSAAATVALIASYAQAALEEERFTALVGGVLSLLYAYLYIVLQLEDYALLMGSVGLFVALAAVMRATRRINQEERHAV